MRKPLPPPVVIDNWPHPPIILEVERPRPKRICGVMVILTTSWGKERRLSRGTYFTSTKAASQAMGFETDRVRRLLRKNRGAKEEGYARFPYVWFISAKAAFQFRYWHHEDLLRYHFPWAFPPRPPMKMIFLPEGDPECVRWVPIEESETASTSRSKPGAAPSEPCRKPAKPNPPAPVPAQSEHILEYAI
jgi:hypothetical protein